MGSATRSRYAVLRPREIAAYDRGGGARTTPLVTPASTDGFINGITEFAGGAAIPFHSHNCSESVMLLSGRAYVDIDDETFALAPLETTFIEAGVPHRFRNQSSTKPMQILWTYARADATRTIIETGETRPVAAEHTR